MRTLCDKLCHNSIPFLVKIWTKKEAYSEEVPIPTPTTALQYTQNRDVPCHLCTDTPILKVYCITSVCEVVVQEWTFTISLPNFLFSDLYLCLYLYCFFGNATRTPFDYNLSYRIMKCKNKIQKRSGFIKNAACRNELFKILFRGVDWGDQSYSDFPAESFQPIIFCRREDICFSQ